MLTVFGVIERSLSEIAVIREVGLGARQLAPGPQILRGAPGLWPSDESSSRYQTKMSPSERGSFYSEMSQL